MRVVLVPTEHLRRVNGALCRLWKGVTERGARVVLWSAATGVNDDDSQTEPQMSLVEVSEPTITMPGGGPDDGAWR